jgi:hypothetical protein
MRNGWFNVDGTYFTAGLFDFFAHGQNLQD